MGPSCLVVQLELHCQGSDAHPTLIRRNQGSNLGRLELVVGLPKHPRTFGGRRGYPIFPSSQGNDQAMCLFCEVGKHFP
jgi:hypothetical protein